MSKRRVVTLIDDLANDNTTEADQTVPFALDGIHYEIDLTDANANILRSRLKEFIQAGRVVKSGPRRAPQPTPTPLETPAGGGATSSRHQSGIDPIKARAWAMENGVNVPKRGRLSKDLKEAYTNHTKFGDRKALDDLLKGQAEGGAAPASQATKPVLLDPVAAFAEATHADDPANMLLNVEAPTPAPEEPQPAPEADTTLDPAEAEARAHYTPLTRRHPNMADDKKWARRTGYGNDRTDKIADWTLTERIATITEQHGTILGQLAGIIPTKNGNVGHLKTSATRLQNMEFIQYAPDSDHGWEITGFGRYAHQMYSLGE